MSNARLSRLPRKSSRSSSNTVADSDPEGEIDDSADEASDEEEGDEEDEKKSEVAADVSTADQDTVSDEPGRTTLSELSSHCAITFIGPDRSSQDC